VHVYVSFVWPMTRLVDFLKEADCDRCFGFHSSGSPLLAGFVLIVVRANY
jgi:hypothetical protein